MQRKIISINNNNDDSCSLLPYISAQSVLLLFFLGVSQLIQVRNQWIGSQNIKPDTEDLVAMGNENHPGTFVIQTMGNDNQHKAPGNWHEQNIADEREEQFSTFTSLPTVYLHKIQCEV